MAGRSDDTAGDSLDRGLAAAFGPGPASRGALATLAASIGPVPRVLLRDTEAGPDGPLVRPASPEVPDAPGRYQLFGEIARGGMGAVLKGRDTDLGRDLAVKVLLEQHSGNPDLVRRFIEEAQIGGQLQHPGVVPVYELGTFPDRRPYFAMKLVKGRTLAALLDARGQPSDDRARFLGIFGQVCQTVAYAHARGVIHRDLKPSNVMVGAFGEVQVMDWGLAKVLKEGGDADDVRSQAARAEASVIRTVRSGSAADASQAGSVLGTPAYMAPEQAGGDVDAVDERADVFGLGSILCEVLTGRPAYTGRTGHEVLRKAARGDTADALARLEASGADADLLSLAGHCLAPEPSDRPREAGAVAARLTAHLNGVQERLRSSELARAGAQARAEEEAKRRRLTVALAASLLVTAALAGGGWTWIAGQRANRLAATGREVNRALAEAADLRGQARTTAGGPVVWDQAIAAARHADSLLSRGDGDEELRVRARSALVELTMERDAAKEADAAEARDRRLLERYEDLYADQGNHLNLKKMEDDLRSAYREYGLDLDTMDPAVSGARIAARPAAVEIAATLDQWIWVRRIHKLPAAAARLVAVVKVADPDPWRNRLRDALGHDDKKVFHELAASVDLDALPAQSVLRLAWALRMQGEPGAAVALLVPLQRRRRDDYLVNQELAECLTEVVPPRIQEALRYRTAAAALRPKIGHAVARLIATLAKGGRDDDAAAEYREAGAQVSGSAVLHYDHGVSLKASGQSAKAIDEFRQAARLDGESLGPAFFDLVETLGELGRGDEVIDPLREIIRLRPDDHTSRTRLAVARALALRRRGKLDEAVAELHEAIRLRPDEPTQHHILGLTLAQQGKSEAAIAAYREAARLDPASPAHPHDLGMILKASGRPDEAIAAFREAVRLDGDHDHIGDAFYTLAETLEGVGRVDESDDLLRHAARHVPDDPLALRNLARALARRGKDDEAIAACRRAIRIPGDGGMEARFLLGDLLQREGRLAEAFATFSEIEQIKPGMGATRFKLGGVLADQGKDAEASAAYREAIWLDRHYPETAARLDSLARLPAVLRGDDRPRNASDGIALARLCHGRKHDADAIRLLANALDADPAGANDLAAAIRYNAACLATLAAAGKGNDGPPTDETRSGWRRHALDWLRADLARMRRGLADGSPEERRLIADRLRHAKGDADLITVRDAREVVKLPAGEQAAWRGFWQEVEAVRRWTVGGPTPGVELPDDPFAR